MGTTTMEAFGIAQSHHDTPDFMRLLNNPSMLAKKKLTPRYYEDMVLKKKLEMRVKGLSNILYFKLHSTQQNN